jgi:hypothetical protein
VQQVQAVFDFIQGGGAMAVVVIVLYAVFTGRLRLGREIDRETEERLFYRDRLLPILERQQDVLEELKRNVDNRNS